MVMDENAERRIFQAAGVRPTPEQVEATTKLHNLLIEQLSKAPAEKLKEVEPHHIQPTRPSAQRRRSK